MTFFFSFFLHKKEKEFRVPLSGCGPSTSCWEAMQWRPAEGVQVGWVTQTDDQNVHFENCQAAQHFPKARLGVVLFCWTYCFFTATASLFSEEAFQGSTAALSCLQGVGLCKTTTLEDSAPGMMQFLSSFLLVSLVLTCVS